MGETYQALSKIIRSIIFCFLILTASIYQFLNCPCPETNHNNQIITSHWYGVNAKQIRQSYSCWPSAEATTSRSTFPHWPPIQASKKWQWGGDGGLHGGVEGKLRPAGMGKKRDSVRRKQGDGRGDYLAQEVHVERRRQRLLLPRNAVHLHMMRATAIGTG
jgi:hypothetical protein